jgi:hypothetical protein
MRKFPNAPTTCPEHDMGRFIELDFDFIADYELFWDATIEDEWLPVTQPGLLGFASVAKKGTRFEETYDNIVRGRVIGHMRYAV